MATPPFTPITIKPNWLGYLFGSLKQLRVEDKTLLLSYKKNLGQSELELTSLLDFPELKAAFWGTKLSLHHNNQLIGIGFLKAGCATRLAEILENHCLRNIERLAQPLIALFVKLTQDEYLRDSNIQLLDTRLQHIMALFTKNAPSLRTRMQSEIYVALEQITACYPLERHCHTVRESFENRQLEVRKKFYDSIESNPLTTQQRLSVIRNNDINMVLAAAGTGKTSVMVAKALDLIDSKRAEAHEILILAYNRDAATELRQRLQQRSAATNQALAEMPEIATFHSLGRKIIKDCKASVKISKFAEDDLELKIWLTQWLQQYIRKNAAQLATFLDLAYQPINPFNFKSKLEYDRYVRDNEYRTLNGERVRGYQELLIANWLFMHGVPYTFEKNYPKKARIEIGYDYRPDFHLTGTNIYIEHFGIDREGNTRPDIDAENYRRNMERKRQLHKSNSTVLIETFHYEWMEGSLEKLLQQKLLQHNVEIQARPHEEMFAKLEEIELFEQCCTRYKKCLQAIRNERLDQAGIVSRLQQAGIVNAQRYSELLSQIHDAYVAELERRDEIDFDDMILKATALLENGIFTPGWKHILVDEFQDISMARLELLQQLYGKGPRPHWTVVGDDWQSIYRFSGGKLEVTTRFDQIIGSHSRTNLDKTYRYNQSIADTAGQFIMENPEQYKKQISSHQPSAHSRIHLYDTYLHGSEQKDLTLKTLEIYQKIRSQHPQASIAVLARYNYMLADVKKKLDNDKNLKLWTFHGSKGLEAEHCILIGFFQGKSGFPNQNKEENLIEALLPMLDNYPHSEERRLFYVALTRAKNDSYIIADADAPSQFINELLAPKYRINIESARFQKQHRAIFKCPLCSEGYFILKRGSYGPYYTCSGGSVCRSKPRVCEKCSSPSSDQQKISKCQNPACHHNFPICDQCGRPMSERNGKFGTFLGCKGYGISDDQCCNTRKI